MFSTGFHYFRPSIPEIIEEPFRLTQRSVSLFCTKSETELLWLEHKSIKRPEGALSYCAHERDTGRTSQDIDDNDKPIGPLLRLLNEYREGT